MVDQVRLAKGLVVDVNCVRAMISAPYMLDGRRAVGLERAADKPSHEVMGTISLKHVRYSSIIHLLRCDDTLPIRRSTRSQR